MGAGSQGLIEGLGVKRKLSCALLERETGRARSKWIGPSQYTSMEGSMTASCLPPPIIEGVLGVNDSDTSTASRAESAFL